MDPKFYKRFGGLCLILCFLSNVALAQTVPSDEPTTSGPTDSDTKPDPTTTPNEPSCKLEIFSTGCKEDADCSDFNGHQLICSKSTCQCPLGPKNCSKAAEESKSAQYESCLVKECAGHGIRDRSTGQKKVCAQKLGCAPEFESNDGSKVTAVCYTCKACRAQGKKSDGKQRFNCSVPCEGVPEDEEEEEEESEDNDENTIEDSEQSSKENSGNSDKGNNAGTFLEATPILVFTLLYITLSAI